MSKIHNLYLSMKQLDKDTLLLFKSGIFYIFISDDARIVSQILNLKLVPLNSEIFKCGFPLNSLNKNLSILRRYDFKVKIIDVNSNTQFTPNEFLYNSETNSLLTELSQINIDTLSIKEAYSKLEEFSLKANNILKSIN